MFFRDMLDEKGNKIHYRNRFFHIGIVIMFIVVESYVSTIVGINAGSGNDRTPQVAAYIFNDCISITEIGFGINIEAVFVLFVNGGFGLFKRRTNMGFKSVKEGSLKGFTQIGIVEILNNSPEAVIRETAFGEKTVDMRIPFERPAEGMEDTDETGNKVPAFIQLMKKSEDDTADGLEKAVKEGAVIKEERAQVFINGKDEMSVGAVD